MKGTARCRLGAECAERNGVPVVSSAGNQISTIPSVIRTFIDTSNIDAGAWGIFPGTLPTVIGVGTVNAASDLSNLDVAGSAASIWARPTPR